MEEAQASNTQGQYIIDVSKNEKIFDFLVNEIHHFYPDHQFLP